MAHDKRSAFLDGIKADVDAFVFHQALKNLAIICDADTRGDLKDNIIQCYMSDGVSSGKLFQDISDAVDDAIDAISEEQFGKNLRTAQNIARHKMNQYVLNIEAYLDIQ